MTFAEVPNTLTNMKNDNNIALHQLDAATGEVASGLIFDFFRRGRASARPR